MTVISFVLGSIVFAYTILYVLKRMSSILHFFRCKRSGELQTAEGRISEKIEEDNRVCRGSRVNICFPKYEYIIGGEKRYCQSTVRYYDAGIGQTAEIAFCERTGESWVIKDVPYMKKDLLIKVSTMLVILTVLVLTEIML